MLLRESSEAIGETANLLGANGEGDGSVPHGDKLTYFAEAATRGSDDLASARGALVDAVGPEAFVEAAATVGIFNGLVRVADATGIPLDDGTRDTSRDFRASLGLDRFGGAANTDLDRPTDADASGSGRSVAELFK